MTELPEGIETEIQRRKAQLHRIGPISPEVQARIQRDARAPRLSHHAEQRPGKGYRVAQPGHRRAGRVDAQAFVETFDAIAEEFKSTFNRLFGGGTAKMVLTDPDNLTTDRH